MTASLPVAILSAVLGSDSGPEKEDYSKYRGLGVILLRDSNSKWCRDIKDRFTREHPIRPKTGAIRVYGSVVSKDMSPVTKFDAYANVGIQRRDRLEFSDMKTGYAYYGEDGTFEIRIPEYPTRQPWLAAVFVKSFEFGYAPLLLEASEACVQVILGPQQSSSK